MACTQLRPSPHGKRPGVNRQIQLFPNEHPLVSHQATAAAAAAVGGKLFIYFFYFLHSQRSKKARQDIQIETLSQLIKGDNIIIFIIIALPVDIKIYNEYSSVERLFRAHLIVRFCIMQTLFLSSSFGS